MSILKIIGLRVEKYIAYESRDDYSDESDEVEREKHVLCVVYENGKKAEIELSASHGLCPSGYTSASWGHLEVKEVDKFSGFSFVPKTGILTINEKDLYKNYVYEVDSDGDDQWYPSGGYSIDMSLFRETIRNKSIRQVWIFLGKSGTGKTFLSSKLNGLEVYETDSSGVLPTKITASVVVLGNKYSFDIEDIKRKIIGKAEIHIVVFN
jgi:hypothetical protein